MSVSSHSQETAGERSRSQTIQVPLTTEFTKALPRSSARFGTLSHHSFFSRHNPHPHRVRHIQGLNGRPVCMVRDDWFVTSSLFPHPLLKSNVLRNVAFPLVSENKNKLALFSEAWRDELKDLAARIRLSAHAQRDKKEEQPFVCRKTQYSAETGRIIPPSTKSYQRRVQSQHPVYPQPFHDQELMVLELLCQILQTDSLSTVQQWLLLAGQREKYLVMGMIKQALDGVNLSHYPQPSFQHQAFNPGASPPQYGPSVVQPWRQPQRTYSNRMSRTDNNPERIGDAEVLEVHAGATNQLQNHPL